MTEDQSIRIILGGAIMAVLGVFAPQIMRGLRRIGFRRESEVDTTGGANALKMIGTVFLVIAALLVLGSIL